MDDDSSRRIESEQACNHEPPPPPDPSADVTIQTVEAEYLKRSNEPLSLTSDIWDINAVSAIAALRMLTQALEMLAEATGDVPPTPPISRPSTPMRDRPGGSRSSTSALRIPSITIGSPEAHLHEEIRVVGAGAEEHFIQHAAIGRRFFSKVAPSFTLQQYLDRLHHYCPHSPGVYLAAASYCYRLCVMEYMVPATKRTVHRLSLAAIRVASKSLEDNKWSQERFSKVGGIGLGQLLNLEVSLCFLLDFDLWVDETRLQKSMFLLQQAAKLGTGARGKLSDFRLRLPSRRTIKTVSAAA